jgi:hypothetical protein
LQQFTVPQFIDVEDKIIGPVTTRQFIIMLSAAIVIVILYKIFYFSLFLVLSIVTLAIFSVFAFVKVNGRPFHFFVINIIKTMKKAKYRVWVKLHDLEVTNEMIHPVFAPVYDRSAKNTSRSRLNELSLIVDTRGVYQGEIEEDVDIQKQ